MSAIDPEYAMDFGKTPMAGFEQRHAGIRCVQYLQVVGLHEGCGVQQRSRLRHDALGDSAARGRSRSNVTRLPGCTRVQPARRWSMRPTSPFRRAGCGLIRRACSASDSVSNLLSPIGIKVLIGALDGATRKRYGVVHDWLTNKFINVTTRTVENFDASGAQQDDRPRRAQAETAASPVGASRLHRGVDTKN